MIKFRFCYISILILSFIVSRSIIAQDNQVPASVTIYSGGALPFGNFAGTAGTKDGFANIGYFYMIEVSRSFNESISWTTSLSLAINGFDEIEMQHLIVNQNITAENYKSFWGMTGIRLESSLSPSNKVYILGQLGFLSINYPVIKISYYDQVVMQSTASSPAIALGIGVGLIVNKVNLGLRYLNSNPKHNESTDFGTTSIKMNVSLFQVLIGYNL